MEISYWVYVVSIILCFFAYGSLAIENFHYASGSAFGASWKKIQRGEEVWVARLVGGGVGMGWES
ncbi:hypothetical protein ACE6H2_003910 [Prunus campanulata]